MRHHGIFTDSPARIGCLAKGNFLRYLTVLWITFCSLMPCANAYNMRQTISGDGLSNSAILSLCCDSNGYLWIGTCDGVNIADGTSIFAFQSLYPGQTLSGNIIEEITDGDNGDMWILTNYALDLVEGKSRKVKSFPQFHGQELMCTGPDGKLFVLSEDAHIYRYDPDKSQEFQSLGRIESRSADIRCLSFIDGSIWAVATDGIYVYDGDGPSLSDGGRLTAKRKYGNLSVRFAKEFDGKVFVISGTGDICEIGPDGKARVITNISAKLSERGRISDMVHDHQGNFFVSFSTDGVLWVGLDERNQYIALDLGLHVGVFCLEGSSGQDVVWIGSDCQGVYTYWDDSYSIRSYDFNALGNKISHPVRAVYIDEYSNMWLGTKGDGLLRIAGMNEFNPRASLSNGYLFTSSNSELCHNSVFALCRSRRPLLWIGTDDGLNYYSYKDNKLHKAGMDTDIKYIHGVYEENDSTLWMCTLGMGVIRASISGSNDAPLLKDVKVYTLDGGHRSANQFFSMTTDGDGTLIFCNRGKGLFRINDGKLSEMPVIKEDFGTNAVKDVFVARVNGDVTWLGTGKGLIKSWPGGEEQFSGIEDGFANNTIHDMILTGNEGIWLSTNEGIVKFDTESGNGKTYGRKYGLSVTEYSDGAAFDSGRTVIFGGINGLTFINRHETYQAPEPYVPVISFLGLSISGQDVPLEDYLKSKDGKLSLELASDQNYFAITIGVPDFIDGANYVYYYSLDGKSWINNASETTISFNGMNYGTYNLMVRYMNQATGVESDPWMISIKVNAPWYLSGFMKMVYLLMILAAIGCGVWLYLRRQKQKQEEELKRLEHSHREEVYEEKLKFFTNITHEFCTPLTLIYGPCERISNYPGSDDYIKKYIGLVRTNAERLNTLIQELIDFRRMETGHKKLKVTEVGMSELCSDISTSFSELADRNNVTLIDEIEPSIAWPTDFGCVRKIMTNLISNAFKYTPSGGTIRIGVREEGDKLRLSVYNTGKGISEDDKKQIFNRYSVLDNVEENAVKGLSARNGLGLAICHSMVDMLKGRIAIESEVGKYAEFIVTLPKLQIPEENTGEASAPAADMEGTKDANETAEQEAMPMDEGVEPPTPEPKGDRSRILVVDDNRGILTLLKDSLSEFDVEAVDSADLAVESIRQTPPDLIISDIMMPGTDGVTFTRMIRQNKHTMHIPLILLSAKNRNEEKVEGIESGADAYIGKPFSTQYLVAMTKRLLENRKHLREYYSTSASAYEYTDGQLLHKEDKDFLDQITAYIEENIDSEELGPEQLAAHMKISVRNLYRKFKELEQLSPNDFIKYQRISYAARLLLTTSATVQEILYRSGFTNRSHFYKEFDKRFGMTPKAYRDANVKKDTSLENNRKPKD